MQGSNSVLLYVAPVLLHWRDYDFLMNYMLAPFPKMNWLSVWRRLSGFSFDSINLHVCSYANLHCLDYCNLEVSFEIRKCESSNFSYSKPPWISKSFRISLSSPTKKSAEILLGTGLHLWMDAGVFPPYECYVAQPMNLQCLPVHWNFHSINILVILWMPTCVSCMKWVPEYI